MITADYHVHSCFSSDSDTCLLSIIETAIKKGLDTICLTDHHDIDFPVNAEGMDFQLNTPAYLDTLSALRRQYADKIDIRIGVELGLMGHIAKEVREYTASYPFDFIIGSSHLVNKIDPYDAVYFEGRTEIEAYRAYFESILENATITKEYDVYGHLDYVVRYGPTKNQNFRYADYEDIFEAILKQIISDGKGIEINTAGLYKGLGYPHPHMNILKRYKELGGEIITVGSDGHTTGNIAYGFDMAEQYLLEAGFRYYTVFKNRLPEFRKLDT